MNQSEEPCVLRGAIMMCPDQWALFLASDNKGSRWHFSADQ